MGEKGRFERTRTKQEGVYFIMGTNAKGDPEKIFYISYYAPDGKRHYEKAGRAGRDDMTPSRAVLLRAKKMEGEELPNVERREEEEAAKLAAAGKWTFNRLWEAWKADKENTGKRGTVKADQRYRKHLKDPFGDREPSDLKPLDIDRLRLSLSATHAKATTVSVIGLIRRIERYGASKGLCLGLTFPIILRGKKLGSDPEVKRAPSDGQFDAYVEACESWPDVQAGNFQLFIAFTGIRRGSARNLKWTDLDLDGNPPTAILKDSKTGDITIVLGNDAAALLRNHPGTDGNPYVFTGADPAGNRSQRQVDKMPRIIANAAGLPADLDPCHSFRRRLATKVEGKFGIATAMAAGGWKTPAMVLNYTATSKQTLRDAANLLGRNGAEAKAETA